MAEVEVFAGGAEVWGGADVADADGLVTEDTVVPVGVADSVDAASDEVGPLVSPVDVHPVSMTNPAIRPHQDRRGILLVILPV